MIEKNYDMKIEKTVDLFSRINLINYVESHTNTSNGGETKSNDTYKVAYGGQNNGGKSYYNLAGNIVNNSNSKNDLFLIEGCHWIGNATIAEESMDNIYEGTQCIEFIDKLTFATVGSFLPSNLNFSA